MLHIHPNQKRLTIDLSQKLPDKPTIEDRASLAYLKRKQLSQKSSEDRQKSSLFRTTKQQIV